MVLNWTRIFLVSVLTRSRTPRLPPSLGLDSVTPPSGLFLDSDSIRSGVGLESVSLYVVLSPTLVFIFLFSIAASLTMTIAGDNDVGCVYDVKR